jgi:hypothetical protein
MRHRRRRSASPHGAAAREVAWAQRAEATGESLPASVARRPLPNRDGRPVLVIDQDDLVVAHSEKESAAATLKPTTFGFHPVTPGLSWPQRTSAVVGCGSGVRGRGRDRWADACGAAGP